MDDVSVPFTVNNPPTGGVGYDAGIRAGGAATQATSKSTAVTLDRVTGQVTMNAASLAAGAKVSFTVNNAAIRANDVVLAVHKSGGTAAAYDVQARFPAAGSFAVDVTNMTAGALAEAVVIGFIVLRGAIT